ncbi:Por secretion system C-terminal sorting domain-containing protein [Chitinophaga sp. YR573]|uniref:hypothetical protein n=1 Tax=Chitinophaga sp. YR573 TaxID=1881040 RepID=UPI0008B90481|nr:hypothetical protein [Chitinophaga sp. YR573]SEW29254.1 Por secretion system C-terminal sorting domain-containing protein [Chitinophaga sp. YR573]
MIKRTLLLLCLPLLAFTGRISAQQQARYQLTVDNAIMGFGSTAVCNSLYELSVVYANGSANMLSSGYLNDLPVGVVRTIPTKTIVFSADNPVTGFATWGKRFSACNKTEASTYDGYDFPNIDRTCYDVYIGGLFPGFHQESSIHATIKPLSNVYNLEIVTNEPYPGNSAMDYDVSAYYTDGTSEQLFAFIWTAANTTTFTPVSRTFNAVHSSAKKISYIHVASYAIVKGTALFKAIDIPFDDQIPGVDYDKTISDVFSQIGGSIRVTYNKVMTDIVYGPVAGSNILPTDQEITLTGPSGIPTSQYIWQYQVDNGAWQYLTSNTNPLRISGKSLFGASWEQNLNKLVRVKMIPACAPDRESATVTLDYRLSAPIITSVTPKNISCTGANDGGFSVTFDRPLYPGETLNMEVKDLRVGTGGTLHNDISTSIAADGTYTWPTNTLSASDYQITVTGGYNGRPTSIEGVSPSTFTLTEPTQVTFSTPTPANVKCYAGSDGSISLSASGGWGGYVAWYKEAADNSYRTQPFNANTNTINGLSMGDYLVQVKDQNGCPGKAPSGNTEVNVNIKQPDVPLAVDATSITNPKAYGYTDGSITVHLKGGTPNADGSYNIEWRKADGTLLTPVNTADGNGIYTTTISNQADGDYTLTVTDANYNAAATDSRNGCTLNNTFVLTQPPLLVANIQIKDSVSCTGKTDGRLTAQVSGGIPFKTPPYYTYEWYQVLNGTTVPIGQTEMTAVDLPAGLYQVKAKDANGITILSDTTDLVDPAPLQVQFNTTPATCYDGSNGTLEALVSGGTTPYRYNWSNGSQAAHNTGLHAGTYTVDITDYHGCPLSGDSAVAQPAAPLQVVQPVLTRPLANGYSDGSIKILLQGGTPTYNVSWQKVDGTPLGSGTGQVVAGGYENLLSGIPAGDYTVTITDANYTGPDPNMQGCTVIASFSLNEPPPLEVTIAEQHYVSCKGDADGVLTATASGGVRIDGPLPYRFAWYKGNNAIGQTTPTASGLTTGTYKVIITDSNNIEKAAVPFVLVEPNVLQVQLTTTPVTCASGQDGAVTATVTGGTAPFNYEWTNGEITSSISNLTEGAYLVFVKDVRGCETQNKADVFIPNGMVINADITAPMCAGYCDGAINTLISGGIPPYQYAWSNGATGNRIDQLCAGKYTLTIQDANNCKRVQSFNLPDASPLQVQLGADKTLCNAQSYTVNAAITDPVATYTWGGQPTFQAATPQVTLSKTGKYWVSVMDGKGCIGHDTINIQQQETDIAAEFVVSTQVFRNEEVSLVNISHPLPERTLWEIPSNITVLQNTTLLASLRFADTGVYRIRLHSYTGECEQVFTKDIAVLEPQSLPAPGGAQQPFITAFEVLPNPNTGQFTVRVTLDKASEIRLRLFNIISNQLVNDRKESSSAQFNIGYQLNITAGTYVLLLETPLGNAIRKIIITQ